MNTYDNPINYEGLVRLKEDKFSINTTELKKFNELDDFLESNQDTVENKK